MDYSIRYESANIFWQKEYTYVYIIDICKENIPNHFVLFEIIISDAFTIFLSYKQFKMVLYFQYALYIQLLFDL